MFWQDVLHHGIDHPLPRTLDLDTWQVGGNWNYVLLDLCVRVFYCRWLWLNRSHVLHPTYLSPASPSGSVTRYSDSLLWYCQVSGCIMQDTLHFSACNRSCGKVMFPLSVYRGSPLLPLPMIHLTWRWTLKRIVSKRRVRILLECFLVMYSFQYS